MNVVMTEKEVDYLLYCLYIYAASGELHKGGDLEVLMFNTLKRKLEESK